MATVRGEKVEEGERSERCAYASASKNTVIIIAIYIAGVTSSLFSMYINRKSNDITY